MRKIFALILLLCIIAPISAYSTESIVVYDIVDIVTNNYQGDVVVVSGLDKFAWGYELGYLYENGYADKNKKVSGVMGLRFIPVNEDGSFCKKHTNCSWEEQQLTIETDVGPYQVYLPAGNEYKTDLYFYVAFDGTTYWAKSGHTTGLNSNIDLSFEEAATEEHLARVSESIEEVKEDLTEETEQAEETIVEEKVDVQEPVKNPNLENSKYSKIFVAILLLSFVLYVIKDHFKK